MKRLFIIYIIIFYSFNIFAQIKLKPDVIQKANSFIASYPNQKFAANFVNEVYKFRYSTIDKQIYAYQYYSEQIMSLKENSYFHVNIFYDEKSNISELQAKNYRNAKEIIYPSFKKYASDGIFYQDAMICHFGFSLDTRGDNVIYSYKKEYKDIKYLTKTYFHKSYPIKKEKKEFIIPDWLNIELMEVNFEGFDIQKKEEYNEKKKIKIITYIFNNVEPIVSGNYSTSYSNQWPHILVLSKSYIYHKKTYKLFESTNDLYAWYASLIEEMDNKPEEFKSIVDRLIKDKITDKDKIKAIYYWVQDNIRYIAYEDGIMGFKPANANDVCKKRFGDCKGMANLTVEMLKLAGYDARLTWIGTRSIPYNYSIPSLAVDNHMIATVILDGKRYFLDATEKGVAFNDYAYRIQGQDVLIENGDDFIIDTVPVFDYNYNKEQSQVFLKLVDDKLEGKGSNTYIGEERIRMYRNLLAVSKVDLKKKIGKYLGNFSKNYVITNLETSDYLNRGLPINFSYNISISNKITSVSNEKYINLEMDFDLENLKTEERRNTDLDFHKKIDIERTITLELPKGIYKVDYLPENINIDTDEYKFKLVYIYNKEKNLIEYKKNIILKNGYVSVLNFEAWNKIIKEINKVYNDQIVLIKE